MMVKVCGLTPKTKCNNLENLSIDYGGLIFVKESLRYVGDKVFQLPASITPAGVFRNELSSIILETAERWMLETVQLHGEETPEDCQRLRTAGLKVIKAIPVSSNTNLNYATSDYSACVDYFLFDSPGGGTGHAFDWSMLNSYTGQIPFLLAGGIAPGFGESLIQIKHPQFKGIDINSRFEISPGEKDTTLIKKFLSHELSR